MLISLTYIIAAAAVGWVPSVWHLAATGMADFLTVYSIVDTIYGSDDKALSADDLQDNS